MALMWTTSWSCLNFVAASHGAVLLRGVSSGRGFSWRSIQSWNRSLWSGLRRATSSCARVKTGSTKPLLMYGMAAFLWERERIQQEDVHRCLRYYEERVRASSNNHPAPATQESSPTSPAKASWMFGWFSRHTPEVPVCADEPVEEPPVDKTELKRQLLVEELTTLYTENSQRHLSQLPLVGLSPQVPRRYKVGSSVVRKTRASVANLLRRAEALTHTTGGTAVGPVTPCTLACCEDVADLACVEVELHPHTLIDEEWFPVAMETNNEPSLYPLVGLHNRRSKVVDRLTSVIGRPVLSNSLENLVHIFDQVLGVDSVLDHSVLHQANNLCQSLFQRSLTIANNFLQEEHSSTRSESCNPHSSNDQTKSSIDYLSDWEVLAKGQSYVVYRKPYADTGLSQFKVIGTYDDVTAKDFYVVQFNEEARMSWDHYATQLKSVDFDPSSGCEVIHWIMKFPFPMSSREYVYVHKSWVSQNEDAIVFVNRSVAHPSVPESSAAVRVRDYYSEMVIKAHTYVDEPGLNYELTYFDDPQVYLPSSCINWVTTTAMPDFLSKAHSAVLARRSAQEQQQLKANS